MAFGPPRLQLVDDGKLRVVFMVMQHYAAVTANLGSGDLEMAPPRRIDRANDISLFEG
jgi:hypothetical protein